VTKRTRHQSAAPQKAAATGGVLSRIWAGLSGTELKLWHMIIALAINLFAAPYVLQLYNSNFEKEKYRTEQVRKQFDELGSLSREFEILSSYYVHSLLERKQVDEGAQKELLRNISEQSAFAESLQLKNQKISAKKIKAYRDSLSAMRTVLPKTKSVLEMAPFWEAASKVLVSKREVLKEIEQASDRGV